MVTLSGVAGESSLPRPNWSRPLPRPLTISTVMDLVTPADVRTLIGHLPKETLAKPMQHRGRIKERAAGGDTVQVPVALQMVLMLGNVECAAARTQRAMRR